MFLHVCVILFTMGSASVHAGIPPGKETPLARQTPLEWQTPLCSACWEIWSTSGQYASYWNAILFLSRSCGKVMFLHLSVILFTGGHSQDQRQTPLPPPRPEVETTSPDERKTPPTGREGHCSGQYASY